MDKECPEALIKEERLLLFLRGCTVMGAFMRSGDRKKKWEERKPTEIKTLWESPVGCKKSGY